MNSEDKKNIKKEKKQEKRNKKENKKQNNKLKKEIKQKNKKEKKQEKRNKKETKINEKSIKKQNKKLKKEIKQKKNKDRNKEKYNKKDLYSINNKELKLYYDTLNINEKQLFDNYFIDFKKRCKINKSQRKKIQLDLENAILFHINNNISLSQSLDLLDINKLGGFFSRPSETWFSLDDSSKIYPISMGHGNMSIFRLSVYLKENVVPELLQIALMFTIKRFPSFATTLKKGFFWHYLDSNRQRYQVEEEKYIPCQPIKVSQSGSKSFKVLYYNNRISVEFFHVLTDGTGGLIFLKALISEYLRLKGIVIDNEDLIWDINEAPNVEEIRNEFEYVNSDTTSAGFIDKKAVEMNGYLSKIKPCQIFHYKMNINELKNAAKKHNCKITTYALAIMFIACKKATDKMQGDISINVPVNMRQYYPSKTVRNFSLYFGVRIPITDITDIDAIVPIIDKQLQDKATKDNMTKMVISTKKLINSLNFIPLVVKQPVAKVISGFLGEKIFTTTLSNLGVVNMPKKYCEYIESMDFVLSTTVTNRASCSMITYNDVVTFTISKMTVDPTFERQIYELLKNDNINIEVEGSDLYEI